MKMLENILRGIKNLNLNILITAANKEIFSNNINKILKNYEKKKPKCKIYS